MSTFSVGGGGGKINLDGTLYLAVTVDMIKSTFGYNFNSQVDRSASRVSVVTLKEDKNYDFLDNMFELVLDCLSNGVVPTPEVHILLEYLATCD